MSKKLVISLEDDGTVYRGKKLIATVTDGEIKFKHYSYKKHQQEIEMLMSDEDTAEPSPEPIAVPVPDPIPDTKVREDAPKALFVEGNGRWYGELNPPVVLWRQENWSKEDYDAKYGRKEDILTEIFKIHNLIYDRNNSIN